MTAPLRATFWDVQHGSAAWLVMPNGEHIVFDLGSGSLFGADAFSPLRYLRDQAGVQQLAAAIISHPHRDTSTTSQTSTGSPRAYCCARR